MRRTICDERGLTLLELCFTLLIVGLIVTLASPRLRRTYASLKLKTAARNVAQELEGVRRQAMLSGFSWRFRVWSDGRGYVVERRGPDELGGEALEMRQSAWEKELGHRLPEGYHLEPVGETAEWDPQGPFPELTLRLLSDRGEAYEVEVKRTEISVHRAALSNL